MVGSISRQLLLLYKAELMINIYSVLDIVSATDCSNQMRELYNERNFRVMDQSYIDFCQSRSANKRNNCWNGVIVLSPDLVTCWSLTQQLQEVILGSVLGT